MDHHWSICPSLAGLSAAASRVNEFFLQCGEQDDIARQR